MGLRPIYIFFFCQCGDRLLILTSEFGPRAERANYSSLETFIYYTVPLELEGAKLPLYDKYLLFNVKIIFTSESCWCVSAFYTPIYRSIYLIDFHCERDIYIIIYIVILYFLHTKLRHKFRPRSSGISRNTYSVVGGLMYTDIHKVSENTWDWTIVGSKLTRRLRRRPNIDPALVQCLVFAGVMEGTIYQYIGYIIIESVRCPDMAKRLTFLYDTNQFKIKWTWNHDICQYTWVIH